MHSGWRDFRRRGKKAGEVGSISPYLNTPKGRAVLYLVCQGHTYESAMNIPVFLLNAISAQIDMGYLGPEGTRRGRYIQYLQHTEMKSIACHLKTPLKPQPLDEVMPPAGWTEHDVYETKQRRLMAEFDAGC